MGATVDHRTISRLLKMTVGHGPGLVESSFSEGKEENSLLDAGFDQSSEGGEGVLKEELVAPPAGQAREGSWRRRIYCPRSREGAPR